MDDSWDKLHLPKGTPEEDACVRKVSMVWLRDFADTYDKDQRERFIQAWVSMDKQRRIRRSCVLSWAALITAVAALAVVILKAIQIW